MITYQGHFWGLFADVENINQHIIKILWSGFYFALSYILISYSGYAIQSLNAAFLDYNVIFSYDSFQISGGIAPWSVKRIAFVFLAGPIFGLLVSWFAFFICNKIEFKYSHLRLFFFWLSINGFAMFYSYFFTGLLAFGNYYTKYFTGFAAFLAWLYLEKGTITLILLVVTILFTAYPLLYGWLTLSNSYSIELLEEKKGRKNVFINVIVLPFITGIILIVGATYPLDFEYQVVRWMVYPIIFFIIYLWLVSIKHSSAIIKKGGIEYRSPFLLLTISSAFLLFGKYILSLKIVL
jgi:hypothetical protein